MKIIHRGIAPTEKTYRCTCNRCGTQVEFRADDPEVDKLPRVQTSVGGTIYWPCPVCNNSNSVRADMSVEDQHDRRGMSSQYDR